MVRYIQADLKRDQFGNQAEFAVDSPVVRVDVPARTEVISSLRSFRQWLTTETSPGLLGVHLGFAHISRLNPGQPRQAAAWSRDATKGNRGPPHRRQGDVLAYRESEIRSVL